MQVRRHSRKNVRNSRVGIEALVGYFPFLTLISLAMTALAASSIQSEL